MVMHPTDDEMPSAALEEAQDMAIETMGRLAEFWGFTRTMGRVYGALFLSTEAMTQQDIVERLGVSAANVSMSLNGLIRWGAVHKVYEKGRRKLQYAAEPELRKIIRNVLGSREQREIEEAVARFREANDLLRKSRGRRRKLTEAESFVEERIEHLEFVVRISNKLLELLLGDGKLDVKAELGDRT
ncbi:MAG: GbsR/MarR family transcriptional regulator [Myxococcota bacterium]